MAAISLSSLPGMDDLSRMTLSCTVAGNVGGGVAGLLDTVVARRTIFP